MSVLPPRSLRFALLPLLIHSTVICTAQCEGWQQRVHYTMAVDLDDNTHRFSGRAELEYTNNSPDTLHAVFFHLYFNAFRPGSEMDVRSRTIVDPDPRIGARIAELTPDQMGELHVTDMTQNGKNLALLEMGTVMKADLAIPLLPGKTTTLHYAFNGQVPIQIRRSGRNSAEGVAYSMTQWYPKLAEYDRRGWHATPYVVREFHGVWGTFDVTLTMDSAYTVAATGVLQNPQEVGHGYPSTKTVKRLPGKRIAWHFVADNVHDFAWVADKDYVHTTEQVPDGPLLHFFHKNDPELAAVWKELPNYMVRCFAYMEANFGKYPWPQFTYAQGGEHGMEYPMFTLITGKRRLGSLVGTSVHETVHSWFYGVLANNEGRYSWMDEGFTKYADNTIVSILFQKEGDPHAAAYAGYKAAVESGIYEAPVLHADHFLTNQAYAVSTYSFGELFVQQLGTVVGEKNLAQGLRRYFEVCGFKHPEPIDLERVMEKQSGLELDWYFDEWINTVRTADYGIRSIVGLGDSTRIVLERNGDQLMPVDLEVRYRDGRTTNYHIPLSLMLGAKPADSETYVFTTLPAWQWTNTEYTFTIPAGIAAIASITLDPTHRVADMDRSNDSVELPLNTGGFVKP